MNAQPHLVHPADRVSARSARGEGQPSGAPVGGTAEGVAAVELDGVELARYVYLPDHPQLESPKPYFHPLRTLAGDVVSCYRPWDHLWHKGLQLALPHVDRVGGGDEVPGTNFWGGPTFVRDRGYTQLPNNGAQEHVAVDDPDAGPGAAFAHRLDWRTEQGAVWLTEQRSWRVRTITGAWTLRFDSRLRNASGRTLRFGSPTTHGRPAAGYGGLFWRGPRSFTGGAVLSPAGEGAENLMGERAPWLAYVGRHDGETRTSTICFVDDPANPRAPTPWFVRSQPYAAVCPAPFFDEELDLADGDTLSLGYDLVVAGERWDADRVEGCVRELRG